MKRTLFITIDTEEDNWGDYDPRRYSVENIRQIPIVQELFDRYEAIPTYLVNYPVATNSKAVDILEPIYADKRCEIGTHLHPWNTPPFSERIVPANTMLCNLPQDLIGTKLGALHGRIKEAFGACPVCFRAGRWGFNGNVARALIDQGYLIDSSITPFVDWSDYHGPNFSGAYRDIYRIDPHHILEPTPEGKLIEVPPSIGFFQKNSTFAYEFHRFLKRRVSSKLRIIGILDKLNLLNFRWLCPELSDSHSMIRLARAFIENGCQYLNMSFHSTTLLPGKSPYVKDTRDLADFLDRIREFLEFADNAGFSSRPLSHALNIATGT